MSGPVQYRRLPGRAVAPFRRRSLWLAPDHVLSVRSTLFSEDYRRFYLRDIQAIVIGEKGGGWTYFLFAIAIFLLLAFALLAFYRHSFLAVLCGIGAVSTFTLGIRMPNCSCYLRTATTTERLPSLGRLGAARKTIAVLRPAIEAAQSDLARPANPVQPPPLQPS